MKNITHIVISLVSVVLLYGCNAIGTINASDLNKKGLVVGSTYEFGYMPDNSDSPYFVIANMKNKSDNVLMDRNYMIATLPPGDYKLTEFGYKDSTYRHWISVEIPFSIEAGKVTNLGNVYAIKEDENSKEFSILSADTSTQVLAWLKQDHPETFNNLSSTEIIPPKNGYASQETIEAGKKLTLIRQTGRFAAALAKLEKNQDEMSLFSWGNYGTSGWVNWTSDLKVKSVDLIPVDHAQYINTCSYTNDEKVAYCAYTIGNNRYISVATPDEFYSYQTPFEGEARDVGIINNNPDWAYIIESKGNILATTNRGNDWFKPGVDIAQEGFYPFNIDSDRTSEKTLVLVSGKSDRLYQIDHNSPEHWKELSLPEKPGYMTDIVINDKGVYLGPTKTEIKKAQIFYKANNSDIWETYELPSSYCDGLDYFPLSQQFETSCGAFKKKTFVSNDFGASWIEN